MSRGDDDDIRTPDTSRSNSVNEDDENASIPPSSPPTEETNQTESSPQNDVSGNASEQIRTIIAAKRLTFIPSSSSSAESESETEPDFVDVSKNDIYPNESASINAVSLLTG